MKTVSVGSLIAAIGACAFIGAASSVISHETGKQSQVAEGATLLREADDRARERMLRQADVAFINGVCGGTQKCGFQVSHRHQYGQPAVYRVTEEGVIIKEGVGVADNLPAKCVGIERDEYNEPSRGTCTVTRDDEIVVMGTR